VWCLGTISLRDRRTTLRLAIDPKPCLADREYDLPSLRWNPLDNQMEDREQTERPIAAFVTAGLDDCRIRAWTVIRGAYLRPGYANPIRALV
jgi:streptomycin 6-kinase